MRQTFFFICLLIFSTSSQGQLLKKNWLVGGMGNFSSRNGTYSTQTISYNSKYTDLTLSPNIGYFLIDRFAVGIRPSFNWTKSKSFPPGGGSTDIKRFVVGPFVRYYILNEERPFNILGEASIQFGTYNAGADKGNILSYSLMAGPVIYFNTSVGIEFLVGYNSVVEDVKNRYKNSLDGFQVGLGFQIHLKK